MLSAVFTHYFMKKKQFGIVLGQINNPMTNIEVVPLFYSYF